MPAYRAQPEPKVQILVNGEKVPAKQFVQTIIANALLGMLSTLRGVDDVETVELRITMPPRSGAQ